MGEHHDWAEVQAEFNKWYPNQPPRERTLSAYCKETGIRYSQARNFIKVNIASKLYCKAIAEADKKRQQEYEKKLKKKAVADGTTNADIAAALRGKISEAIDGLNMLNTNDAASVKALTSALKTFETELQEPTDKGTALGGFEITVKTND